MQQKHVSVAVSIYVIISMFMLSFAGGGCSIGKHVARQRSSTADGESVYSAFLWTASRLCAFSYRKMSSHAGGSMQCEYVNHC